MGQILAKMEKKLKTPGLITLWKPRHFKGRFISVATMWPDLGAFARPVQ